MASIDRLAWDRRSVALSGGRTSPRPATRPSPPPLPSPTRSRGGGPGCAGAAAAGGERSAVLTAALDGTPVRGPPARPLWWPAASREPSRGQSLKSHAWTTTLWRSASRCQAIHSAQAPVGAGVADEDIRRLAHPFLGQERHLRVRSTTTDEEVGDRSYGTFPPAMGLTIVVPIARLGGRAARVSTRTKSGSAGGLARPAPRADRRPEAAPAGHRRLRATLCAGDPTRARGSPDAGG